MFGTVIGLVISSALLIAFTSLIFSVIKVSRVNETELKATIYLQEMIEVVKDLEQSSEGWDELRKDVCNISINSDYKCHPYADTILEKWFLVQDEEPLENNTYTRWLTIENVSRDPITFEILDPYDPANYDKDTKKIIANIEWDNRFGIKTSTSSTLETYLYAY